MGGTALEDGAPEQALGAGHGEQRADAHRAGRLPEDGDVGGVTTEGRDVLAHPREGRDLVEQADVGALVAEVQEPVGPEPPVDDHADDAVAGEPAAVVRRRGPDLEGAALDPHHDRQPRRAGVWRPDVEAQAVLATHGGVPVRACTLRGSHLGWRRPQAGGVTHTDPGLNRLGWAEPVRSSGRGREGDPEEHLDPVGRAAAQLALDGPDHCTPHAPHGAAGDAPTAVPKVPE